MTTTKTLNADELKTGDVIITDDGHRFPALSLVSRQHGLGTATQLYAEFEGMIVGFYLHETTRLTVEREVKVSFSEGVIVKYTDPADLGIRVKDGKWLFTYSDGAAILSDHIKDTTLQEDINKGVATIIYTPKED